LKGSSRVQPGDQVARHPHNLFQLWGLKTEASNMKPGEKARDLCFEVQKNGAGRIGQGKGKDGLGS